jgi:hypothetical protein
MNSAVDVHRLQFAFTVTFHYIFPQLTMGLALLIVVLKALTLVKRNELYSDAARFWARLPPSLGFEVRYVIYVWSVCGCCWSRMNRAWLGS